MKTITFYSYKGGTGRSLALANAAVYLARLGFKVVALDFDLEAPGLHYKFSADPDGAPLPVTYGVVDYLNSFVLNGQLCPSLKDYILDVVVSGTQKPLIQLMPAGRVPSSDYWSKLSNINWHELFYSKGAKGVQVFMELKTRILDELKPDFLLVDSRTGITEMGGVATTLLADKVICLVLPTPENLEGARAVLRSLKRSRRESDASDLEILVAVSRLPEMKGTEAERELTDRILVVMNEEADDLKDTLSCQSVFVLHSEAALQVREGLRVGSDINPDDSVLLRDYLRLFASFVPKESIEPKVRDLIQKAREKIWEDPDAAVKELEELAESFGHPETYRELLRFYEVRNVGGALTMKKAQRLWELTGDSSDSYLWQTVLRSFTAKPRWQRDREKEWQPNFEFVRSVWRDAGKRDSKFGMTLAEQYSYDDRDSAAADVLLEIIETAGPTPISVSRAIAYLDTADRHNEADLLIHKVKAKFPTDPPFVNAWARHALRLRNPAACAELTQSPWIELLRSASRLLAGRVYARAGFREEAAAIAESVLHDLRNEEPSRRDLQDLAVFFDEVGRWSDFEESAEGVISPDVLEDLKRYRNRSRHSPQLKLPLSS